MEQKEFGGKMIEIDEDGFIQDPDAWDQAVAADLAKTEGVDDMTDDHWKVVNYLREYYLDRTVVTDFAIRRLDNAIKSNDVNFADLARYSLIKYFL